MRKYGSGMHPGMLPDGFGMHPGMLPGGYLAKVAGTLPLALLSAVLAYAKALAPRIFRNYGFRIEECRQMIPPPR